MEKRSSSVEKSSSYSLEEGIQRKLSGGLGIKKLWSFNKALIAKLGWNLITAENKLWVPAIKAKYFPHFSFMKCRKTGGCSWLWTSVLKTRSLLVKGVCFKIGKGDKVNY